MADRLAVSWHAFIGCGHSVIGWRQQPLNLTLGDASGVALNVADRIGMEARDLLEAAVHLLTGCWRHGLKIGAGFEVPDETGDVELFSGQHLSRTSLKRLRNIPFAIAQGVPVQEPVFWRGCPDAAAQAFELTELADEVIDPLAQDQDRQRDGAGRSIGAAVILRCHRGDYHPERGAWGFVYPPILQLRRAKA